MPCRFQGNRTLRLIADAPKLQIPTMIFVKNLHIQITDTYLDFKRRSIM